MQILVCGPTDSGKSTLSRVLVNYAVRLGHRPMFVDLDVGQGQITVPGALAASPVTKPIGIEVTQCQDSPPRIAYPSDLTVPLQDGYPVSMPLAFFYGRSNLGDNPKLFTSLIQRMAAVLDEQCEMDPDGEPFLNTCHHD